MIKQFKKTKADIPIWGVVNVLIETRLEQNSTRLFVDPLPRLIYCCSFWPEQIVWQQLNFTLEINLAQDTALKHKGYLLACLLGCQSSLSWPLYLWDMTLPPPLPSTATTARINNTIMKGARTANSIVNHFHLTMKIFHLNNCIISSYVLS